jgi:hypothetical protein
MFNFLFQIHNAWLFLLISAFFLILSIAGVLLVRRFARVEVRYRDNPVLGNIVALIGIIYGVLAGLTALYLINNVNYTADAVQREANSVANLYRDSQWLQNPAKTQIKEHIREYLTTVIDVEWPLMKKGKVLSSKGENIIDAIASEVNQYFHAHPTEALVMHDMLDEVKTLYNAREQRIHMSFSSLNTEIWVVILIGTILTICINYLFKMKLKLHVISIAAASLMASSMMFLLLTLDRPFQGEFVVEPTSLQFVLSELH